MSEVIVIASFVAQAGKESDAEKFFSDLLAETHDEDGCKLYALHRGTEDPRRFAFVERWAPPELLAEHLASEHIQTALARVEEFCSQPPEIIYYESVPGGANDRGSIAGHAAG